jgi:hypothetical protein
LVSNTGTEKLLGAFIGGFEKLDELTLWESDPISQQLTVSGPDEFGFKLCRPLQMNTTWSPLKPLAPKLPAPLS